jgi:hypothetical protein
MQFSGTVTGFHSTEGSMLSLQCYYRNRSTTNIEYLELGRILPNNTITHQKPSCTAVSNSSGIRVVVVILPVVHVVGQGGQWCMLHIVLPAVPVACWYAMVGGCFAGSTYCILGLFCQRHMLVGVVPQAALAVGCRGSYCQQCCWYHGG